MFMVIIVIAAEFIVFSFGSETGHSFKVERRHGSPYFFIYSSVFFSELFQFSGDELNILNFWLVERNYSPLISLLQPILIRIFDFND